MFNLPACLLLIQSGRGVKAIRRHVGLFIPLQAKSWWWYSCNKVPFHCEEAASTVFSLGGSSLCLPEIETWSCQSHRRCEAWGELSTVQITGATARAKRRRNFSAKESSVKQIQTRRCMYRMSERRGKLRLQSGRESDKGIGRDSSLFFLLCLYGVDKFLPHSESVFPCWLKHSRTEPAIRQWGEEVWIESGKQGGGVSEKQGSEVGTDSDKDVSRGEVWDQNQS